MAIINVVMVTMAVKREMIIPKFCWLSFMLISLRFHSKLNIIVDYGKYDQALLIKFICFPMIQPFYEFFVVK